MDYNLEATESSKVFEQRNGKVRFCIQESTCSGSGLMETFSLYSQTLPAESGFLHPRVAVLPTTWRQGKLLHFAEAAAEAHRFHAILAFLGAQNRDVPNKGCGQMVKNRPSRRKSPAGAFLCKFPLALIRLL